MKVLASVLIALGCLLATPAAALAENYVVNELGDVADAAVGSEGCDSVAGGAKQCTLRAAIEESNSSTVVDDTITFAAAFNGEAADTIGTGASFPAITDKVHIDGDSGGQCTTAAASILGPCVGVARTAAGSGLVVENTDGVTIEGLAITAATGAGAAAINVLNSSEGFAARDNWIGVKLDGSAGINTKGIFLDPNSNGATIGGKASADRNVFANSEFEGLDIEGADNADVLGNYFGVKPDGIVVADNAKNIEITDTVAFEATGNEVGATMEGAALASSACDGGCNVLAGEGLSTGIDLDGDGGNEEPASGPTTVHGNYVGLGANGTTIAANGTFDILVGAAEDATIGGPANGDANFIAGGGFGIYNENGEGFEAVGNIIGSGPAANDVTAPGAGVFVLNTNNANQVAVNDNVIEMDGGVGVEARFGGTEIDGNFIEGAELGVWTKAGPGGAGPNLIEDNVIGESEANGIRIEDNENEVLSNAIFDSGAAGIRIQNPAALLVATENLIGGDTEDEENTIRESGGDAIEIVDPVDASEESVNEVARNNGDLNGGLFIDLIEDANGGIKPPTFATSQQSSASGSSAEPGAKVRVFRKGEPGPGEIEGFLAEATADGSGNWKATYPAAIPVGTEVAATQTSVEGGTSELALATTTADPSNGGGGGGGGGDTGDKDKDTKDKKGKAKGKAGKAPETTIVKGPKARSRKRTAKFKFVSSEPNSTFQCKLDKKPFRKCKSPKKYKRLKPGKHVFKVRAIDADGNVDKTPAKRKFRVLAKG